MAHPEDLPLASYGDEESSFYFDHIRRRLPFERNNHYHSTYEIYYLMSGERNYFIKEKLYRIQPGCLVMINRYDVHKSFMSGGPEHERIVINFDESFALSGGQTALPLFSQGDPLVPLQPQEQAQTLQIFNKMSQEATLQKDGYQDYLQLLLTELLLLISRFKQRPSAPAAYPINPLHEKMMDIVQYIHQHFQNKITLELLSDTFYISPYYLSRMFKEVTGFTIISYVNLTRIREAQRRLSETDTKIVDIAEQTGFESLTHFDRTFKKTIKMTASQYRKLYRLPQEE
ncbi:helix-turn-helix domain-containing protein [Paenibacillus sp. F411]|uniref:AraC family transcriptional regulator n=1 Tax=Paenibacillus sp. F411 TaxID=2820239 RepID=UPI001AAEC945|nr:AraC family transcriptional regulator [Paenibacillus sp. F411]MBO2944131.1 helix-turn-helix domain-containing protein [Paenibacillus sp. F411]